MIIAIDPGKSGAIAALTNRGQTPIIGSMGKTDTEILHDLRELIDLGRAEGEEIVAVLEVVGGYIQGSKQPGSSMFNFGRNFGLVIGILISFGVRLEMVRPQVWQQFAGAGTKGARSTAAWKGHLADLARKRWPGVKITNQCGDAGLILDYGLREFGGIQ